MPRNFKLLIIGLVLWHFTLFEWKCSCLYSIHFHSMHYLAIRHVDLRLKMIYIFFYIFTILNMYIYVIVYIITYQLVWEYQLFRILFACLCVIIVILIFTHHHQHISTGSYLITLICIRTLLFCYSLTRTCNLYTSH